jgi:hypothetical protein
MDPRYDWLNRQIDTLQAGKSPKRCLADLANEVEAGDIALLMVAARLNGLRAQAARPDPVFVAGLRSVIRDSCKGRSE